MFNPFAMNKDLKGMEKMVKPALEKFMLESGFVKKEELDKALNRIEALEKKVYFLWPRGRIPKLVKIIKMSINESLLRHCKTESKMEPKMDPKCEPNLDPK